MRDQHRQWRISSFPRASTNIQECIDAQQPWTGFSGSRKSPQGRQGEALALHFMEGLTKRSRKVAAQLSEGISHLLKKNKVFVYEGFGNLEKGSIDSKTIMIKTKTETISKKAKNVIIATGARSRNLPFISSDGVNVWDYKTAMTPPKLPSSLIIIGSGAIGMEFASFYNDLGVDVTVVEALP